MKTKTFGVFPHRWLFLLLLILPVLFLVVHAGAQTFTVLHHCDQQTGFFPNGNLIQGPDGTLYGTATQTRLTTGGSGPGTVFKVNPDGTGFAVLHEFAFDYERGIAPDGSAPEAIMVLDGRTLYGTTSSGGSNYSGTVFKLDVDTTNFSVLWWLTSSVGQNPQGDMVLDNGTLWAPAAYGGNPGSQGTIFKMSTNGSNFSTIHYFYGPDGRQPMALIKSGNLLYGTTINCSPDGIHWVGNVFRMETNGSGEIEYIFGTLDGQHPNDGLVLAGTNLFGVTTQGGSNNCGTIYRISTNIDGFVALHHFTPSEGRPAGKIALRDENIYGVTQNGGMWEVGLIYRFNLNSRQFTVLKHFQGGETDGDNPTGLMLYGNTLYGATMMGGTNASGFEPVGADWGAGIIYSLSLAPAVMNARGSGTNVEFLFSSFTNTSYAVEYKDDLNKTNWQVLENKVGSGSLVGCCYPMTNATQRFFRVRTQ